MSFVGSQHYWLHGHGGQSVVLADGSRAVIRTLAGGEAAVVQEVFDSLSEPSRYQRFLGAKPRLSQRDLELLAGVDDDHVALVAVDPATGSAVAEAHLVRDETDREVADVAFAVADRWQNRRLGTRLAASLAARARELGVRRLRASMLTDNTRSRALLRGIGRIVRRKYDGTTLELEVALD